MVNHELLEEYSISIRRLRRQWLEAGMSEEEFRILYFETLHSTTEISKDFHRPSKRRNRYMLLAFLVTLLFTLAFNYERLYTCIVCHLQDYIYPGLRLLRKLSIPFISLFPSLTSLYHETCLIQNPFFTVVDMDCWPCSTVNTVGVINDPKPINNLQSPPFYYETDQNPVDMKILQSLYNNHKKLFDDEAPKILYDAKSYIQPDEMFLLHNKGSQHFFIWKFNTMNVAKVVRQIIPRPKVVPKFGQSTERFIIVDTSQGQIQIPDTECSFSFLLSLNGRRKIKLVPAHECQHQCKSLQVDLRESYLLWYNWWYWRPVIQPSNGNDTFIGHIGSYC